MFKNPFKTKEPSQNQDKSPNALSIGVSVESNEKEFIDPSKAFGHTYISGQLGSGAKSLSINMAEEQIENGGGLVYLDIQGGSETLERLYEKSKSENRVDDLLIIDIQHPEKSNTYNPLKNGNSAEIAQKISCFFKHVEMKSPKLPCVSDDINEIHTIIMTLQKLGKEFGVDTIRNLVDEESCKGLLYLRDQLAQADIDPLLSSALEQIIKKYKIDSNDPIIDQHFENFITHHGSCSQVLRSLCFGVDSDIDFVDIIKNKKNVYINLNGFANKVDAQILSQLITLDLRASLEVVGGDLAQKNDQPFIFFSNDCLSLVDHSWARLYGYTNPSQFQMIHTNQEPLELILREDHNAFEYKELILGNTEHRLYFKMGLEQHKIEVSDSLGFLVQATINTATKEIKEHSKIRILPLEKLESLKVCEALYFKANDLQTTIRLY